MSPDQTIDPTGVKSRRALSLRPTLRRISVLLWASFLGAAALMAALVLAPEGWLLAPDSLADDTLVFALLWLICLIPATVGGILFGPVETPG